MRVLVLHNRYRESGGEDSVVRSETEALAAAGHTVLRYERDNREIAGDTGNSIAMFLSHSRLAAETIWSSKSYREVCTIARCDRPDVAHFHNTLPLISPSAHWACKNNGLAVVQTLHNYRLLCPVGTFLRDGQPCESCLGKAIPWPGVVHSCYRNGRAATGGVDGMLAAHRAIHTWNRTMNVFIALSEFAKAKFVQGGLPATKIKVKPNFVHPDPGGDADPSDFALFVGRLSEEKGLRTLMSAWALLGNRIPLVIMGDGPLQMDLRAQASRSGLAHVHFGGRAEREKVVAAMKRARFLILPSECYENFPMAVAEAFACGTPAIVSNGGAAAEIVEHGRTGWHFERGNPAELAAKVEWAWNHPARMREMGSAARAEFRAKYTAERNIKMLLDIYEHAGSYDAEHIAPICANA